MEENLRSCPTQCREQCRGSHCRGPTAISGFGTCQCSRGGSVERDIFLAYNTCSSRKSIKCKREAWYLRDFEIRAKINDLVKQSRLLGQTKCLYGEEEGTNLHRRRISSYKQPNQNDNNNNGEARGQSSALLRTALLHHGVKNRIAGRMT
mmetsp:Transcript_4373/g.9386  ORF Transcript_4373/g.9386 Transcript_4373/m.9386 type:complete len:150 (-) Transcript_4373:46-495(-)